MRTGARRPLRSGGTGSGWRRALPWLLASGLVVGLLAGCATGGSGASWGAAVPRDERDLALAGLPTAAQEAFLPLSQVFYERIASRRFNSRATFDDPSVRQFFPSVAAYSDYYASLVDVLDRGSLHGDAQVAPTSAHQVDIEDQTRVELLARKRVVAHRPQHIRDLAWHPT